MRRGINFTTVLVGAVVLLAVSDLVDAATFGPAAPLVLAIQGLGSGLARVVDQTLYPMLGQLVPAGLPVSPTLILGGALALGLGLLRARARRDRARSR